MVLEQAVKGVQNDGRIAVIMVDAQTVAANPNVDPKFLLDLPNQAPGQGFARLLLAAGEFPVPAVPGALRTAGDEH